jgi:hypothetical protein
MVQDARRLVRVPVGVDVCAVLEQEVRHVEMTVDDGIGERRVDTKNPSTGRPFTVSKASPHFIPTASASGWTTATPQFASPR